MQHILDPRLNKGLAFSFEERQRLGIHGLLPPCVRNQDLQTDLVLQTLSIIKQDIDKYVFLMNLLDKNERLFYKILSCHVEEIMPLVYTPTVGEACLKYSLIFCPKGLFITIKDKGHVYDVLCNWPYENVKVICVTDGERILGLGDLGAQGMGIPVGKLALYTGLAGVNPSQCLPITLDVGTNNESLLSDPNYIGLRQKRTTGKDYDDLIDEFINAVRKRYMNCLIQFEDFHNKNAFRILQTYRSKSLIFNDDIQGTASVVLSGMLTSVKLTSIKLRDCVFLFYGAGEAAIGTAKLIILALTEQGVPEQEAKDKIWLFDSKGLVVKNRPEGGLNPEKLIFAKDAESQVTLTQAIDMIKPNVLIGSAAQGRQFTHEIITKMSSLNQRPVIFALSNPTSKSECTAEECYKYSEGRAVFASGSPFNKVEYKNNVYHPGQVNNCYIFPAIGLASLAGELKVIPEQFFIIAAEALSKQVGEDELNEGRVYPRLDRIQDVCFKIAVDLVQYAVENDLSCHFPKPESVEKLVRDVVYDPGYQSSLKQTWKF